MQRPIETKVTAATFGAALGGTLLWLVDTVVLTPDVLGDVPDPVGNLIMIVGAGLGAWIAGFAAKHTHRPDLTADTDAPTHIASTDASADEENSIS
jgi:hypothetical protein